MSFGSPVWPDNHTSNDLDIDMPLAPPSLPPYIFLMSDHTTRQLAVDVAEALSDKYPTVFVEDFLAPIHEAFITMFDLDWKRDMGNYFENNRQFLSSKHGETEQDLIVSLEAWFIDRFGETELGKMARQRSDARNAMADYITVFRDATTQHIDAFPLTNVLRVWLSKMPPHWNMGGNDLIVPSTDVNQIVSLIEGM